MFTLILSTMFVSQEKILHVNTSGTYISLSSSDGAFPGFSFLICVLTAQESLISIVCVVSV